MTLTNEAGSGHIAAEGVTAVATVSLCNLRRHENVGKVEIIHTCHVDRTGQAGVRQTVLHAR